MKKIISILVLLCVIYEGNVYADTGDNINILLNESKLTISGTGNMTNGDLISVMCVKDETDINDISSDNMPVIVEAVNAKDKEFAIEVFMPDAAASGKYYIYANGYDFSAEDYFMYNNNENIKSILPEINSAKTSEDINAILEENVKLDIELYNFNKEDFGNIIYYGRKQNYTDVEFLKKLDECYFASLVKKGNSERAFNKYSYIFDNTDVQSEYEKTENKEEFETAFSSCDFTKNTVAEGVKKAMMSVTAKNCDDWHTLKDLIIAESELFDMSKYNSVSDKNGIFQSMMQKTSEIRNFSDLKTLFEQTSLNVFNKENKSTGSGTSGGSGGSTGGGKGSGVTSVIAPVEIKQNDNEKVSFTDIKGHWAENEIECMFKMGLVNGYENNTFMPDKPVTRVEFVKMVCGAFSIKADTEINFSDVTNKHWGYEYIKSAYAEKLIYGKGTSFDTEGVITREDAVVILWRYITNNYDIENAQPDFADNNDISDYAVQAVGAVSKKGIIKGFEDNTFKPKASLTRAQCVVLLDKCMEVYKN